MRKIKNQEVNSKICVICKKRNAVLYLKASGENICYRCLTRRIERRIFRILKKRIKENSIIIGFRNTSTIVLLHILAKRFKEIEMRKIYMLTDDEILKWVKKRYGFKEVSSKFLEKDRKPFLIIPFSLEEFSATLLNSIMKLNLKHFLISNRAIFPLSKFENKQLEAYAAYYKLPIIPLEEKNSYNEFFCKMEEKTPTIRYQFLSFVNSIKNLTNDHNEIL